MKWLLGLVLVGCAGEGTLDSASGADGAASTDDAATVEDRGGGGGTPGDLGPVPFDFGLRDRGVDRDAAEAPRDAAAPPLDAEPPPPQDAAPALPPPAARPPQPPPDESAAVAGLAAERADLFADACRPEGQVSPFLVELVRRLRGRDLRWGFLVRNGRLEGDRIAYFHGDGDPEGSAATYAIDVIGSYCPRPGVDNPSTPGWLDDTAAGGTWTLAPLRGEPLPDAGPPPPDMGGVAMLPLPDERSVVEALAAERPDLLEQSCVANGGNNEFLFELVRRLRARDPRWGLNWKRGNVGDMSQDVVDYFWAQGEPEGRTEVYIIDVIGSHCPGPGDAPSTPAFTDVTEATRLGGTIGRWTLQPLPQ